MSGELPGLGSPVPAPAHAGAVSRALVSATRFLPEPSGKTRLAMALGLAWCWVPALLWSLCARGDRGSHVGVPVWSALLWLGGMSLVASAYLDQGLGGGLPGFGIGFAMNAAIAGITAVGLFPLRRHLARVFGGDLGNRLQKCLGRAQWLTIGMGVLPAIPAYLLPMQPHPALAPVGTLVALGMVWALFVAVPTPLLWVCRDIAALAMPAPGETTPRLTRWRTRLLDCGLALETTEAGFSVDGFSEGILVEGQVDLSRAPAPAELCLTLPALAAALPRLTLTARGLDEPQGIPLVDPILARLVRLRGLPAEQAGALVDGLHEEVLDVLQGLPGARISKGRLKVRIELFPGLEDKGPDLDDALERCVRLAASLEARVTRLAEGG